MAAIESFYVRAVGVWSLEAKVLKTLRRDVFERIVFGSGTLAFPGTSSGRN